MSVDLSPDIWTEIQRQLATGSYASYDEVLREALAALRSREDEVLAIQQGIDDMEAGRVTPIYDFDREFVGATGCLRPNEIRSRNHIEGSARS